MNSWRILQGMFVLLVALVVVWIFFTTHDSPFDDIELVLKNGKIVTMDDKNPEGQALAIKNGRIIAVGSDEEIERLIDSDTKVIDLDGNLAIPGFIDSHMHFIGLGESLMELPLAKAKNYDEIVEMVKESAQKAKPGEWILGHGWHQEKWNKMPSPNIDGLPFNNALSAVSPDNPVLLSHASGHLVMANDRAMELAGITKDTPDPKGGEIVRDNNGNPIGVFRENAEDTLYAVLKNSRAERSPEQVEADRIKAIKMAEAECLSKGVTSVHDAGVSFEKIDLYKKLAENGQLDIRIWAMIGENNDSLKARGIEYKLKDIGDHHLSVGGIKRSIDGALGSHGAWLLEPYDDLPASTGLNTEPIEDLKETARFALDNGFQLCTHAIGDRGNRETLDIYKEIFGSPFGKKNARWRIEHAQHIHPDDIGRIAVIEVIAAMQGVHATSDGPWVPKRLGEKRSEKSAYVWRKLIDAGVKITNGTDAPVEDVDPLACFYASVTRRLPDGTQFYPEQCMIREEALRSYTLNGAYAAFEEDSKGSLTPGKLADITVLSKDIMTIPAEEILETEVVYTIVGGEVVFRR